MYGGQFDWGGLLLRVTEEYEGALRPVGNRSQSIKAKGALDCETDTSSRYESRS